MRLYVASALFPILAVVGCSNTPSSLSEAQASATLQSCISEVSRDFGGTFKTDWKVMTVGPMVKKGPNEIEVTFRYSANNTQHPGEAMFVQDQNGKYYLKTVLMNHNTCNASLPLQVK